MVPRRRDRLSPSNNQDLPPGPRRERGRTRPIAANAASDFLTSAERTSRCCDAPAGLGRRSLLGRVRRARDRRPTTSQRSGRSRRVPCCCGSWSASDAASLEWVTDRPLPEATSLSMDLSMNGSQNMTEMTAQTAVGPLCDAVDNPVGAKQRTLIRGLWVRVPRCLRCDVHGHRKLPDPRLCVRELVICLRVGRLDARVVVVAVGVDGEFAQEFAGGGVDDADVEVLDEEQDTARGSRRRRG